MINFAFVIIMLSILLSSCAATGDEYFIASYYFPDYHVDARNTWMSIPVHTRSSILIAGMNGQKEAALSPIPSMGWLIWKPYKRCLARDPDRKTGPWIPRISFQK